MATFTQFSAVAPDAYPPVVLALVGPLDPHQE